MQNFGLYNVCKYTVLGNCIIETTFSIHLQQVLNTKHFYGSEVDW